jgi:tubulin monoglycylase TTLL3/8
LTNKLVHLTNDAVQKRAEDYGKFEPGNKLSYNEFQTILDKNYPELFICFERDIKS